MIYLLIPLAFIIGCIFTGIYFWNQQEDPEIIVIDPQSAAVHYAKYMANVSGKSYAITDKSIKCVDNVSSDDTVLAIYPPCKLEDFKLEKSNV